MGPALAVLVAALLGAGCASHSRRDPSDRAFEFGRDTVAFTNELLWTYGYGPYGHWQGWPRNPEPTYSLRCFVLARTVKQFYLHARFDPRLPRLEVSGYRPLVRRVIRSSPRQGRPEDERIVIPGYPDLTAFSRAQETLLKAECGGGWRSYFQRGHWRMVFPFSRRHQEKTAIRLIAAARAGVPAVVHVVNFPSLGINHALLVYGVESSGRKHFFAAYDPDAPERPLWLTFDWSRRAFHFPSTEYFPGGKVNVYEVYSGLLY